MVVGEGMHCQVSWGEITSQAVVHKQALLLHETCLYAPWV